MIEFGFEFQAMASACELRLLGDDERALQRAAQAAIAEVRRIERKYSRYDAASVVSRINAAAGSGQAVPVDDETTGLLNFAAQLHALSDGRFDITSGVLRRVWDFRAGRLPGIAEVEALLPLIGWSRVAFDGHQIALPQAGMEVDFGGFGKEYAADRAAALLRHAGVPGGYVNLGGDIAVLGPRVDGSGWRLGIHHPRRADAMIETLELGMGALATSGDYERCFEADGVRYCHLLDPRSGWPVRYWQSVSVVAPSCAAAGAACTIAMVSGERGLAFIREQSLPFLAVDAHGVVIRS
ncbi:MAG: FAD:protein FMN transferase [Rubrivivax sp.]|nr:FAD:protein FMN transferase [Rubrivivax sp.]